MKGFAVPIFVFLAVFAGSFAAVFDAKSDAIKAIQDCYKSAEDMKKTIVTTTVNEQKNTNASTGEKDLLGQFDKMIAGLKNQFELDADATIRTAIVQAKPISVIDCISNVTDVARKIICETTINDHAAILSIKIKKLQKINFDDYTANAIMKALKELTDQSLAKLNEKDANIQTLKTEGLQRCESAKLLLGDIEIRVTDPILSKEYAKMRQKIEREMKTLQSTFNTDLGKCLTTAK